MLFMRMIGGHIAQALRSESKVGNLGSCTCTRQVLIKPEEDCRRLFHLAYDLLEPGGLVVVQDYMRIEDDPQRKRLDTLEDLYVLVVFNPGAADREGPEVASWLRDVGFQNPKMIPLPTQLGLVIAEKPPAD